MKPQNNNTADTMKTNESPFGEVIYAYTRKQAIADGVQVDVTKTAQEAGIKFPVFITRGVFESYVAVPEGVTGQDEAGRLWDIMPSSLLCRTTLGNVQFHLGKRHFLFRRLGIISSVGGEGIMEPCRNFCR
jgi:hypothetical protein